uniref:Uncharacterized protein n=1 Tax=Arundo donax TaxID=35708 RepID=A0A0A9BUP0_ARUDO
MIISPPCRWNPMLSCGGPCWVRAQCTRSWNLGKLLSRTWAQWRLCASRTFTLLLEGGQIFMCLGKQWSRME